MFPVQHFVTITLVDQPAPDEGTQDALAHLGLHLGNGGRIQPGRRMKIHARFVVGSFGCVAHVANASGLEYPIHNAAVEVCMCVQA